MKQAGFRFLLVDLNGVEVARSDFFPALGSIPHHYLLSEWIITDEIIPMDGDKIIKVEDTEIVAVP